MSENFNQVLNLHTQKNSHKGELIFLRFLNEIKSIKTKKN
jgi:hypothetical protein